MKADEMDFTASIELEAIMNSPACSSAKSKTNATWCYGVVLWFETGFTSRFCKEMQTVLPTSPYTLKTHWSQTILTFWESIAIATGDAKIENQAAVGLLKACPARRIKSLISIVRAAQHRYFP